jgi:hypothetical protein
MKSLHRRLWPAWLAIALALATAPAAAALPIYIMPFTVGAFMWQDLDGKCVASCGYTYRCPCQPKTYGGFWIPG